MPILGVEVSGLLRDKPMKQIVEIPGINAPYVHMDTAVDGIDIEEIEDTFKDVPSYGFKSRKARFCCALCRRMEKHRGYRCGDK
jgi:hypothetical protein